MNKRPGGIALLALVVIVILAGARVAPAAARPSGPAGAAGTLADPMKKQPYMFFPGDPSQMELLWQLNVTATSTLDWGTDTTYSGGSVLNDEYPGDHQHKFLLTGLTPATKYYFRVTTSGYAYKGSFVSAPTPDATRLEFLAYGDTRSDAGSHDQVCAAMLGVINADPAYQTFTLFMGDFAYYGNNETSWTNEVFHPIYKNIRALFASIPYQACKGNHENSYPMMFTKYYPYPDVAGCYWSFDYGPVHVSIVDQYTDYSPGSAQLLWLAGDLAASQKKWKFVLLHEPGWSAGGGEPNNPSMRSWIEPLCEQHGVSIVFAGHNHYYARAMVNGVAQITTGGGGAPLYTPVLPADSVVTATMAAHFCKIAIDGDTLRFWARNIPGTVLDSFMLVRPTPDLIAPTVAVTAPVGGERWDRGSVQTITWNAADNVGVDSVNVDCSFSGLAGPWMPIAHGIANSGSLSWTLPMQPTDSAAVRVTAFDHALNVGSDASDSLFHIINPSAGVGAGPTVLALARPQPNPSTGTVRFGFSLPQRGHVRLEILDLSGRSVWHATGMLPAGAHVWTWDGSSRAGARVRTGLYFLRLVTPWGSRAERLVRLD